MAVAPPISVYGHCTALSTPRIPWTLSTRANAPRSSLLFTGVPGSCRGDATLSLDAACGNPRPRPRRRR